jgi:hypothetical protein
MWPPVAVPTMPSRRDLLATAGAGSLAALAGCSNPLRPEIRLAGGFGTIHPGSDIVIANGLVPGSGDVYATVVPDEAPDRVGPDAATEVVDRLSNASTEDIFHLVVQVRSLPAAPISLRVWDVELRNRRTLRAEVGVDSWDVLDNVEGAERERLESAESLVYTTIWSVTPSVSPLPEDVELELAQR